MGGTHGLLHPEVVAMATAAERAEIHAHPDFTSAATGISLNTLCESALSSTTGVPFKGLVEVVWERVTELRNYGSTEVRKYGSTEVRDTCLIVNAH